MIVLPMMAGSDPNDAPPEPVADHDHRMPPGRDLIRRQERAAEARSHTQDLKVVAGHQLAPDAFAAVRQGPRLNGRIDGRGEPGKRAVVIAKVSVLGIGKADGPAAALVAPTTTPRSAERLDPGQRLQREALEEREHGGIRADPDRQHGDDDERISPGSWRAAGRRTARPARGRRVRPPTGRARPAARPRS